MTRPQVALCNGGILQVFKGQSPEGVRGWKWLIGPVGGDGKPCGNGWARTRPVACRDAERAWKDAPPEVIARFAEGAGRHE